MGEQSGANINLVGYLIHAASNTNSSFSCCLQLYLPTYLPTNLPTYQPNYLKLYLPTFLPTNLPPYLPSYQPNYLKLYLPSSLPTYLQLYVPTYQFSQLEESPRFIPVKRKVLTIAIAIVSDNQCDQIGRFFGLWQQLICPNLPHS